MSAEETPKAKKKDEVVYQLSRASRCYNCDLKLDPGATVKLQNAQEDKEVLCGRCAQLEGLEFLATGNTKLTQLAKKYSQRSFVVMRWSELWKCYERQGVLVEPEAIDRAENELARK